MRSVSAIVVAATAFVATVSVAPAAGAISCAAVLQTQLDNSQAGDVITVQGICNGSLVLPSHPITLQGDPSDGVDGFDGTGLTTPLLLGDSVGATRITKLTFANAYAQNSTGGDASVCAGAVNGGGAISLCHDSAPTIDHCTFVNDKAESAGGAVYIVQSSGFAEKVTINADTFGDAAQGGNSANGGDGGGAFVSAAGNVLVQGSTFRGNAGANGAGLEIFGTGRATLAADQFLGNNAGSAGGGAYLAAPDIVVHDTVFRNNIAVNGGGLEVTPPFESPTGTLTQRRNRFDSNTIGAPDLSSAYGGGEAVEGYGALTMTSTNDRFTRNVAVGDAARGVGLDVDVLSNASIGSAAALRNAVLAGNHAGTNASGVGASVVVEATSGSEPVTLSLDDSTVAGNQGGGGTTGVGLSAGPAVSVVLHDSIAWRGVDAPGLVARHSDVCSGGGAPYAGSGNVCVDPKLTAPGPSKADVHETSASPTRDLGANGLVPADVKKDYDGQNRIRNGVVDMGADEF